jgi:methyl-accepting chemotaxis protein
MHHQPRLIAGIARQANLSALDAMIGAGRAGAGGPNLASLAAELTCLAGRTAKAMEAMKNPAAGASEADDVAAALTAMRDAALAVTDTLGRRTDATAAKPRDTAGAPPSLAGNATNG